MRTVIGILIRILEPWLQKAVVDSYRCGDGSFGGGGVVRQNAVEMADERRATVDHPLQDAVHLAVDASDARTCLLVARTLRAPQLLFGRLHD